jgi:hypothetical protein
MFLPLAIAACLPFYGYYLCDNFLAIHGKLIGHIQHHAFPGANVIYQPHHRFPGHDMFSVRFFPDLCDVEVPGI